MFRDVPECSGMFHVPGFIDGPLPLIEFTCEKQKYQVTFLTKDSKHLVGTSGDDSSALIEFTPL